MAFREEERDFLLTNAARDRAEHLLKEMRQVAADAEVQATTRDDLTTDQAEVGRQAMEQAIIAAQRMLDSLNQAMALAERAARAGGWEELDALEGGPTAQGRALAAEDLDAANDFDLADDEDDEDLVEDDEED